MALPNKIAVPFILLGKDNGTQPLTSGISGSYVDTEKVQPDQPPFFGYQWFYPDYGPDYLAVVTPAEGVGPGYLGIKYLNVVPPFTQSYPTAYVSQYNPGPPDYQPAPDPNGSTQTDDVPGDGLESDYQVYPRLESETPYDLSSNPGNPFSIAPGVVFQIPVALDPTGKYPPISCDFTAENFESRVFNEETEEYEFYPFAQATTTYSQTQSFKVTLDVGVCCWNEGTIIRGKVFFAKALVDMQPNPDGEGNEWGWQGASGEMPEGPYDPAGDADWEITIGESLESAEIEIPVVTGNYATFINDICVTEVVRPV